MGLPRSVGLITSAYALRLCDNFASRPKREMTGKIFINYRRGDDPASAGRLFDRLQDEFGPQQLFLDVDNIAPGLDFVRVLGERVAECDVVLAVIGRNWVDARDANGNRRLEDPDDFVRIEIASGLSQGKRVIPVLVGEAQMPRPDQLPDDLRPLARRNAVRLTHERFRADTQGLVKSLRQSLQEIEALREAEAEAARRAQAEEERKRREQAALERASAQRESEERTQLRLLETRQSRPPRKAAIIISGALALASVAALVVWFEGRPGPNTRQVPAVPPAPVSSAVSPAPAAQTSSTALVPVTVPTAPAAEPASIVPVEPPAKVADVAPGPRPDEVAWSLLKDATDEAALKRFAMQFPESPWREDAKAQIATLTAARAAKPVPPSPDEVAWILLRETTDEAALKRFTAQYPNSHLNADAQARIAELEIAAKAATASPIDPHQLARSLQSELKRVGCYKGAVNGEFDDATKAAWRSFTKLTSISIPDEVSPNALKAVREIDKRVCPLICPDGQRAENDRCLAIAPPQKAEPPRKDPGKRATTNAEPSRPGVRPAPAKKECFGAEFYGHQTSCN
jgi:hypothetical protein